MKNLAKNDLSNIGKIIFADIKNTLSNAYCTHQEALLIAVKFELERLLQLSNRDNTEAIQLLSLQAGIFKSIDSLDKLDPESIDLLLSATNSTHHVLIHLLGQTSHKKQVVRHYLAVNSITPYMYLQQCPFGSADDEFYTFVLELINE